MDRNTITGLILIFAIFIGFSIYNNSRLNKFYLKAVEAAEAEYTKGNLERARTEYFNALRYKPNQPEILEKIVELNDALGLTGDSLSVDSVPAAVNTNTPVTRTTQPVAQPVEASSYGAFASKATGTNEFVTLENDKIELTIATKGGRVYSARLKEYTTHDSRPLILFDGDSTVFGFNFFTADNKAILTNNLYFSVAGNESRVIVGDDPGTVTMRLEAGQDEYIEYSYTLSPGKYSVDFNVSFRNMQNIIPSNLNNLTLDWRQYIPQQEKGRQNEDNYTTIKYKYFQDEVAGLRLRSNKEQEVADIPTKLRWVAFQDQFFSSVLIANNFFLNGTVTSNKIADVTDPNLRYFTSELGVPYEPGQDNTISLKFYFGPNHISTLRKEGMELDQLVFLGKNIISWINRFVIIPVFNWLEKYIGSYGLIILILTILIKIVLFPLTFKSFQSQAKMQVLKPMVEELSKKFPKKEDAMKKQQATMDLYKRAGVNPMGGCLPMLLQFPILFAMFRFFPVSIELRQESFLWATDLSTYDSILTLPFSIPIYGAHVSLFTILMTISSLLTMKMSGSTAGQDQPGMKMMMYMMPVMFMLILNNFSAGLTYYYFLANMITWIQNVISKRFIDQEKVLATLEENRKKPLKKSKWQMRLEEAARQRGINPNKK